MEEKSTNEFKLNDYNNAEEILKQLKDNNKSKEEKYEMVRNLTEVKAKLIISFLLIHDQQ